MRRVLVAMVLVLCTSLSATTATLSRKLFHRRAISRVTRVHRNFQTQTPAAQVTVKCNGNDDTPVLSTAVKNAGDGFVVIGPGQTCVLLDVTIPSLRVEKGGLLKVVTGHTVQISRLLEAATYQVFDNALPGQGTISFSGNTALKEVYPEWWGGVTTASPATQMGAFQRAVDTGVPVRLSATLSGNGYALDNSSTPLKLDKTASNTAIIEGSGMDTTLVRCTTTARPCIQIDYRRGGAPSVMIKDFHLRGAAGPAPKSILGDFGIYVPGYHDGTAHSISNLIIENMQIDQFGDNGIRIQGPTGPVRIHNPVVNDVGNYGIQISGDADPNANQSQDVTIDGGSLQGQAKGGIAVIGSKAPILSLTIRDIDIELGESQSKPTLYFEQVHGAYVSGVTLSSVVDSLSVGDANIYLADGVYGCTFVGILNSAHGGLHNIHAAGVTNRNTFMGGAYTNKASGAGYLFKREASSTGNIFINTWSSSGTFQRGHDTLPSDTRPTADFPMTPSLSIEPATVFVVLECVRLAISLN